MLVTILAAALVAVTPAATGDAAIAPSYDGGGDPDPYGYRYLDSDTVCPGAPTYNWIDIKGVGTEVENLGDDNVVGPFDIGFDFPYYWYTVNSVFVGSNGYIAFHDNALAAPDFDPVPNPERPNNTLAAMMADLNPSLTGSPNGSVWYWTNAAADTFIVQYDSIRFWRQSGGDGNNTFQIILSRPDSAITFQYKEQSGQPSNGWVPTSNQCGIENLSGQVGVNYLSGNIPLQNMYEADLAVRFIPPDSTSYEVHDVGIRNALNDRNGGVSVINGQPLPLWAVAKNFGNQSEADYKAYVKVTRISGSVLFFDSADVSTPNPGDTDSIVFGSWTPTENGTFITHVYTRMSGDMFPPNDTAKVETQVLTPPAWLTYDDGSGDAFYYWNGPGGYGARFVPPVYPCSITGIRFMAEYTTGSVMCSLYIYDDDGPGGSPGTRLHTATVAVAGRSWYTSNPPSAVVIEDGAFFVGATSTTSSAPSFGMDTMPPLSGQSWEYTGVWAPSRDLWVRDAMFNAMIRGATGVAEWIGVKPSGPATRIDVSPNPFGTSARLQLVNARGWESAIEIYDAAGSLVRTLDLEGGAADFDGRNRNGDLLAGGIYFARIAGAEAPVAKVIISR